MKQRFFIPTVFSMEIRRIFTYRVDFWVQFIGGALVQFGVAWFLWRAIYEYRGATSIGPFTFRAMMLYYILVPIIGRAVRGSDMGGMAEEIYQGTLTRYLVYPVSFFGYKLAAHFANALVFICQGILVAGVFFAFFNHGTGFSINTWDIAMAVGAIGMATILHFVLVSTIELLAFWADNIWSLVVIVRFMTGLLGGGMLPLTLFPDSIRGVLLHLPFAYLISFPVRCLQGRVSGTEWVEGMLISTGWCILFSLLFWLVWRAGKYRYTGVGI